MPLDRLQPIARDERMQAALADIDPADLAHDVAAHDVRQLELLQDQVQEFGLQSRRARNSLDGGMMTPSSQAVSACGS